MRRFSADFVERLAVRTLENENETVFYLLRVDRQRMAPALRLGLGALVVLAMLPVALAFAAGSAHASGYEYDAHAVLACTAAHELAGPADLDRVEGPSHQRSAGHLRKSVLRQARVEGASTTLGSTFVAPRTTPGAGTDLVRVADFADDAAAFGHYSKHVKGIGLRPNGGYRLKPGGVDLPEYRHAFDSGFENVSRFSQGTSARQIQTYADDALRYGNVTQNGASITYDVGRTIGLDQAGNAVTGIQVWVRDGYIRTAYPVAVP